MRKGNPQGDWKMKKAPACPLPEENGSAFRVSGPKADSPPQAMTPEQARAEAQRCLSLHSCQGCEVCQLICPDQAITTDPVTRRPIIDLSYCKGCGLCAHICPKRATAMVLDQDVA
jgi:Pyruvate/2-oxoacid:ferredoxin oxidoreductase delta subunit